MSTAARWFLAILALVSGQAQAAFVLFAGAFSTVACTETPPDWGYYVLLAAALTLLSAAAAWAGMITRRSALLRILAALLLGAVVSGSALGVCSALLGNHC